MSVNNSCHGCSDAFDLRFRFLEYVQQQFYPFLKNGKMCTKAFVSSQSPKSLTENHKPQIGISVSFFYQDFLHAKRVQAVTNNVSVNSLWGLFFLSLNIKRLDVFRQQRCWRDIQGDQHLAGQLRVPHSRLIPAAFEVSLFKVSWEYILERDRAVDNQSFYFTSTELHNMHWDKNDNNLFASDHSN